MSLGAIALKMLSGIVHVTSFKHAKKCMHANLPSKFKKRQNCNRLGKGVHMLQFAYLAFSAYWKLHALDIVELLQPEKGAQWLSGRVLDSRPRVRASPA